MDLSAIPDPAQYEAALVLALAAQPVPPAITGFGIIQNRQLVCGLGDLAGGGRGIARYRVVQFPLRPGVELVVVVPATPTGQRPDPATFMRSVEAVIDKLRAIDRATGSKSADPFVP